MRIVEIEKLYCDCCGKEVKDIFTLSFIMPHIFDNKEYEMCKECSNKFKRFLKEFIKIKGEKDNDE